MKNTPILFLFTLFLTVGCGGGESAQTNLVSDGGGSSNNDDGNGGGSSIDSGSGTDNGSGTDGGGSACGLGDELNTDGEYSILYPFCVRTGRVIYQVTSKQTSSTADGTMVIDTTGEDSMIFTDWGNTRRLESTSHSDAVFTINGEVTNISTDSHKLSKIIDRSHYHVDFGDEEITRWDFTDFISSLNIISNYILVEGEGIVYEDDGSDFVAGYTCEQKKVADLSGTSCAYKGIELKTVIDLDITTADGTAHMYVEKIATAIEFDTILSTEDLALPDYPVINGAQLNNDNPSGISVIYAVDINAVPLGCSDGSGTLIVKDDVINGTVSLDDNNQVFDVSGEIGPDRKIHGGFVRGDLRVADYEGIATDTGLSGEWQDFGGCYGTWETR